MGRSFLFVTWSGGGNVNPVLAMTARLADRGHAVRVLGSADLAPRFEAVKVAFAARAAEREWDTDAMADDVVAEVGRAATDALVVDYMMPGALVGAEVSGLPTAAFVHTLYAGMRHYGDLITMYMASSLEGINATRSRVGLEPVAQLGALLESTDLVLITSPRELDNPSPSELAANVRYVGPVLEPVPDVDVTPADIVVSMGTTAMDEGPVIERICAAAEGRSIVVTVGAHLEPSALSNATGYVPHGALLPHAKVLVNHAGLGGVLAALAHGVPQLCIPLGRDQPTNAAAVERLGAGLLLPPDASVEDIAAALDTLLTDDRYRDAARAAAATIARYGDKWAIELEALANG